MGTETGTEKQSQRFRSLREAHIAHRTPHTGLTRPCSPRTAPRSKRSRWYHPFQSRSYRTYHSEYSHWHWRWHWHRR
jgi:hypothetical protein